MKVRNLFLIEIWNATNYHWKIKSFATAQNITQALGVPRHQSCIQSHFDDWPLDKCDRTVNSYIKCKMILLFNVMIFLSYESCTLMPVFSCFTIFYLEFFPKLRFIFGFGLVLVPFHIKYLFSFCLLPCLLFTKIIHPDFHFRCWCKLLQIAALQILMSLF